MAGRTCRLRRRRASKRVCSLLFLNEVRRLYRPSQIMAGIRPADRGPIIGRMRAKAEAAGWEEAAFWQEAVEFWNPPAGGTTASSLTAKLLRFNTFINNAPSKPTLAGHT